MAWEQASPDELEASEQLRLKSGEHRRMQAGAHFGSPNIVCLCGSTRFGEAFKKANLDETLAGRIVLSIGCILRDDDVFASMPESEKEAIKVRLDWLHMRKIEWADEVLILNVKRPWCEGCLQFIDGDVVQQDGFSQCCCTAIVHKPYIGPSTRNELAYARKLGKVVRFLEPEQV